MTQINKLAGNLADLLEAEPGHFYMINVDLTAAAGASVTTSPSTLVGSMPFAWEELGIHYDESNGDWEVKIMDDSEDKAFSSDKIQIVSICGDDKQPYRLLHPWIFAGGAGIYVEATNNGSGSDTLFMTFIGKRLTAQ